MAPTTAPPQPPVIAGPSARPIVDEVMAYLREPHGGSQEELFRRLATEAPVVALPLNMYLVASAALVRRAAAAPQLVIGGVTFPSEALDECPDFVEFFGSTLSFLARADHHRLRRVLSDHFTPAGVDAMRPALTEVVHALTDEVSAVDGEVDFVTDYANHLPMRTMGLLLGIPPQEWAGVAAGGRAMLARLAHSFPNLSPQDEPITNADFLALEERVGRLLDDPGPPWTLSASLRAAVGRAELSRLEATRLMLLLFMTGIDTVAASLTNVVTGLVGDQPARSSWLGGNVSTRAVIEESLRLRAPLPFGMRVATAPFDLGPVTIPAGATVLLCNASANIDPDRFTDPLTWAPGSRPLSQTFGHGTYRCLGAMLAVLQCELALNSLAPLGVRITDQSRVSWRSDISFHTPTHLPVEIGRGWTTDDQVSYASSGGAS